MPLLVVLSLSEENGQVGRDSLEEGKFRLVIIIVNELIHDFRVRVRLRRCVNPHLKRRYSTSINDCQLARPLPQSDAALRLEVQRKLGLGVFLDLGHRDPQMVQIALLLAHLMNRLDIMVGG